MKWIIIGVAAFFVINMVSDSIAEDHKKGEKISVAKVLGKIAACSLIWPYELIRILWYWISPKK